MAWIAFGRGWVARGRRCVLAAALLLAPAASWVLAPAASWVLAPAASWVLAPAASWVLAPAASWGEAEQADAWKLVATRQGIEIYNRVREGARVKEIRAVGVLDAPPWVCKNVVDDIERFDEFMPYTAESTVLEETDEGVLHYERVVAPLVSDRDYTLISRDDSRQEADGRVVYQRNWTAANERGPEPKRGVVRVAQVEGFWRFEPIDAGRRSRVTYYVFTDPGGRLPAFVVEAANRRAVPGLFAAVEEQAQGDRYRRSRPAVPGDAAPQGSAASLERQEGPR